MHTTCVGVPFRLWSKASRIAARSAVGRSANSARLPRKRMSQWPSWLNTGSWACLRAALVIARLDLIQPTRACPTPHRAGCSAPRATNRASARMAPHVAAGGAIARFEGTNAHQPYFFFGRMGAWWVIAMFEVRRTIAFQVLRRAASTVLVISAFVLAVQVQARWKPEYASQPPEVQQWYRNAELTAAAQARFRFKKCCDHADVVKTKFNVNRTTSGDEWY